MSVRIRADRKIIVCAAMSEAEPGDCYLGDDIHYVLAVELGALRSIGKNKVGADLWKFCVSSGLGAVSRSGNGDGL